MRNNIRFTLLFFAFAFILFGCTSVNVPVNNGPVITLKSDFVTTYEVGSATPDFLTAILAVDDKDGIMVIKAEHIKSNDVNMNVVGQYKVIYEITDSSGNKNSFTVTITVVDTTKPEFIGLQDLQFTKGSAEPNWLEGISATDNYDGNIELTLENVNTSQVNMNMVGSFRVSYTVKDSNNNENMTSIRVTITAPTNPTISGLNDLQFNVGSPVPDFLSGVSATDYLGNPITLTNENVDLSLVNMNQIGTFTVTYTVRDQEGNQTVKTRTVTIINVPGPIFSGLSNLTFNVGTETPNFLTGITARDYYGTNLPLTQANVDLTQVNMNHVGSFIVTYRVKDAWNNETVVTITVTISDNTSPTITLNGSSEIVVFVGQQYDELGATATDNHDGDLSQSIIITGTVDINTIGSYVITYQVKDSSLNEALTTRTIRVVNDYSILIVDPNLADAIRDQLGLSADEPITYVHVGLLTYLDASERNITNLSGIEHFINLNVLDLYGNEITDITPLKTLYNNGAFDEMSYNDYHIYLEDNPLDLSNNQLNYQTIYDLSLNGVLIDIARDVIVDNDQYENISINQSINSTMNYYYDTDYYTFVVTERMDLSIYTTGNLALYMTLYDDNTLYHDAVFGGTRYNPVINATLDPGTYYIELNNLNFFISEFTGPYELFVTSAVQNTDDPVHFNDDNLEGAIRELLNKPTDDITVLDCQGIGSIELDNLGITDLTGLEQFTNLELLFISNNNIVDLSPISQLTKLKYLIIDNNSIVDISSIENLVNLEVLILSDNQIIDITALENLTQLTYLDLQRNQIENINVLRQMYDQGAFHKDSWIVYFLMYQIELEGNPLDTTINSDVYNTITYLINSGVSVDIAFNLPDDHPNSPSEAIELQGTTLSGSISYNNDLDWFKLVISEVSVVNFNVIHPELYLDVYTSDNNYLYGYDLYSYILAPGTYYIEVSSYRQMTYTIDMTKTQLDPNSPEVVFVDPDLETAVLSALDINFPVTEAMCPYLTDISSTNGNISSLQGIECFTNLETIDLSNNQITDLSPLEYLINLRGIYLDDNLITNIDVLLSLSQLEYVYLSGNSLDLLDPTIINVIETLHNRGVYVDIYWEITSDDHGNDFTNATLITGNSVSGVIEYDYDVDYFKFELLEGSFLNITVSNDLDLYIYDGSLNNFDSPYFEPGIYYVEIMGYAYNVQYEVIIHTITPTEITLNSTSFGNFTTYNEIDIYQFTLTREEVMEIYTRGDLDTVGVLYDENFNYIDEDDDDFDMNFHFYNTLTAGTYYLVVYEYYGDTGNYQIITSTLSDNFETAPTIEIGQSINGSFVSIDDKDYYKFTVTELSQFYIHAHSENYLIGSLCNSNYYNIYSTDYDELNNGNAFGFELELEPGVYYIVVENDDDVLGNYQLFIDEVINPTPTTFQDLTINTSVTNTFDGMTFEHFYRIIITEPMSIELYAESNCDTVGTLYNGNMIELEYDDDGYQDSDFMISYFAEPGTYYLLVEEYYDETGTYELFINAHLDQDGSYLRATEVLIGSDTVSQSDYEWDVDWYKITLDSTKGLSVYSNSLFYQEAILYDEQLNEIAYSDYDYYMDTYSFRLNETLDAGVYYLKVWNEETGPYTLSVRGYDDNNDITVLVPNTTNTYEFLYIGDTSKYQFTLNEDAAVEIYALSTFDIYAEIKDASNQYITYSDYDSYDIDNAFRITTYLEAGTYYLDLEHYDNTYGDYTLTFNVYNDLNHTYDDAVTIPLGTNYQANIEYLEDQDYYQFTLDERKTIYIYTESNIDFWSGLFDSNKSEIYWTNYNELLYDDDNNIGFEIELDPGTYYIELIGFDLGEYDIYVTEVHPELTGSIEVIPNSVVYNVTSSKQWFKVTLLTDATLEVFTTLNAETSGELYDANLNLIDSSYYDYFTESENIRIIHTLPMGIYYILVEQNEPLTTYDFNVIIHDDIDETNQITLNSTTLSQIDYYNDLDQYAFTLPENKTVYIYIESEIVLETYLSKTGSNFSQSNYLNDFAYNDYSVGFKVDLLAGDYNLEVYNYDGSIGDYTLYVTETAPEVSGIIEVTSSNVFDNITNDVQWFKITVPSDATLEVFTTSNGDTYGELYDSTYNSIDWSGYDTYLDSENFRMIKTLSSGVYYLRVEQYEPLTTYNLNVFIHNDDNEVNNISVNSINESRIDYYDDIDYYQFTLNEQKNVYIYLESDNASEIFITNNDDFTLYYDSNELFVDYQVGFKIELEAGTYDLQVYNLDYLTIGDYTLYVSESHPEVPNTIELFPDSILQINGIEEQWFKITFTQSKTLDVFTTLTADTYGDLYDEDFNLIASNDYFYNLDSENFRIIKTLPIGTYYIRVGQYEPFTNYNINVKVYDDFNDITPMALNTSKTSQIDFYGDEDTYEFYVQEAEMIFIYANSVIYLESYLDGVFLTDYNELAFGDYAIGYGIMLAPGIHHLKLSTYEDVDYGSYEIFISEVHP